MILYHFTSRESAALIVAAGRITPEPWWYAECPPVVWLAAAAQRAAYKGWPAEALEHTEVRFTVDLPVGDVSPWRPWAMGHGVSEEDCEHAADGRPARWYVCERPILRPEWARAIWSGTRRSFAALD